MTRLLQRHRIQSGRFTADIREDFVVFLIGMRINKPFKVHRWYPVAAAMPGMLRALVEHPELGCLGYHQWSGRTTLLLQYWRDFESLNRFASDRELPHLEPWRAFNRAARNSPDVGIWHEAYLVKASAYKTLYADMPSFGLAAATRSVAIRGDTGCDRRPRGLELRPQYGSTIEG